MLDQIVRQWIHSSCVWWRDLVQFSETQKQYCEGMGNFQTRLLTLIEQYGPQPIPMNGDNRWSLKMGDSISSLQMKCRDTDVFALTPIETVQKEKFNDTLKQHPQTLTFLSSLAALGAEMVFYHCDHGKVIAHFQYVQGRSIAQLVLNVPLPLTN